MKQCDKKSLLTLCLGAAGMSLRLLQNMTGFEPGTGLPIPGSIPGILLPVLLALSAVILFRMNSKLPKGPVEVPLSRLLNWNDKGSLFGILAGGCVMAFSGVLEIANAFGRTVTAVSADGMEIVTVSAGTGRSGVVMGLLAVVAGICLLAGVAICRKTPDTEPQILLAVPVLYAAVNCLAVALTWLGQQLAELLLDGFTMPDVQPVITRWLTPVYQLICDLGQSGPKYSPFLTGKLPENYIQNADCASGLTPQGWRTLLIFTAVALVLTVLSRLLYGRRKSELSGDAAAFSWMRPVFRLGVGLVGGLPLGMLLYILVSVGRSGDFSPARLCVCMAVMGIVCYLAAAMLVGKTLRVLPKRLPGAAVTALVLVLLCVVLRADVFGYADRTPQAEDVARARVYCLDTSFTLEDPQSLETLVKAQAELAENRAANVNYRRTFEVHYVLKDGTSMARCYRLTMTEPVKAALEQVARLEEVQTYVMFNGNVPPSGWQPTGGGLWLNAAGESRELTAEEAQALYDAAWRDVQAKNVLPVDGDYAWLGVEITLFRDGDSRTISSTKSSYKELTQALLDLGIPAEDIGEINID